MTPKYGIEPPKRSARQHAKSVSLLIMTLFGLLVWFPGAVLAEEATPAASEQKGPDAAEQKPKTPDVVAPKPKLSEVAELKEKALDAFVHGRYAEATACNLKIVHKFPGTKERHSAVQMLGTIYEDNLVDLKQAIKWDREFLEKYADSRQIPFYKEKLEKLAALKKGINQEEAFKAFHNIKFANRGDAYLVKNYEALLKAHPDFSMKVEVQKEIAYSYDRMNKPKESYAALQAIVSQNPGQKLSTNDQIMAEANHTYYEMNTTWKWVAWGVVAAFWGAVLLMKPWRRLDRGTVRSFLIWTSCWALLVASRMPTFYSLETGGYKFDIKDTAIYTMGALNIPVILWLILLVRGKFWLTRPRALRWTSPLLTLMMTVAVLYLFVAYQPNGPSIVSTFGEKYDYLIGEFRTKGRL
jgi:hypothetical protein